MRSIVKLSVIATLAFSICSGAIASDQNINKMRVVSVNSDNYQDEYESAMANDPLHGFNYAMFKFNDGLDQYLVEPLARGYRFAMPKWGRDRVSNIFNNLGEPTNFVNSILQGDIEGAFRSFWRFFINSTFGVAGMHDVAAGFGLEEKSKGFSQTLALYGLDSGPYLVLPLVGPSSPRDFVALAADSATKPTTYMDSGASFTMSGLDGLQTREKLLNVSDDMRQNSFDLYSSFKSSYLQHRRKKVLDTLE